MLLAFIVGAILQVVVVIVHRIPPGPTLSSMVQLR